MEQHSSLKWACLVGNCLVNLSDGSLWDTIGVKDARHE